MNKLEAKQRIEKLRETINYHRYLYHVLDRQEISDAALDSLKHELYKHEQQFPDLITPDSPTQRVGGKALEKFAKVTHTVPMLSLEDVFSFQELQDWQTRILKLTTQKIDGYYSEIKMDGLAVSLVYEDGLLTVGATRGDGKVGENVTENLKTIEAIPLSFEIHEKYHKDISRHLFALAKKALKGRFEVRGEAFMSKKVFEKINKEQERKGSNKFANPRNASAGAIRQLDSKITAERQLDCFIYDIVTDLGQKTHEESHLIAKILGFKVNPFNRHVKNLADIEKFHEEIFKKREKLAYWTDGVVVVVNDINIFKRLGVIGKTPRGMIAYKFAAEQATTEVSDIEISVGRTGVLTPVAVLKPVFVMGTTVTHASLHNEDYVNQKDIRIGDTVIIQKAGDIIPEVVSVVKSLRPKNTKRFIMPPQCPICGFKVVRISGEVAHKCVNPNCFAKRLNSIQHFVGKSGFDIVGLGPAILEQLYKEGLIQDAADLFTLKIGDFEPLERFAEKSALNLYKAIQERKKVDLWRFFNALGILHVGIEKSIDLAKWVTQQGRPKNLSKLIAFLEKQKVDDLVQVKDFGPVVAQSVFDYFHSKENQFFLKKLIKADLDVMLPTIAKHQPFAGKSFVFTGELESLTRDEVKEKVRDLGGDVSESVSKLTSYVVVGSEPGSKYEKAKRLGVHIITEAEFLKILK